jgi:hypothetical protein
MSNLMLSNNLNDNKIIIEDDIDDSFNSFYSNKSNKSNKSSKKPIKKSFITKINEETKDADIIINKKKFNTTKKYNKKYILNNKTKEIMEKSYQEYCNSLENYYKDVLEWLNMILSDNNKSILKLKFKKITLNEDIFNLYNQIIKKYKIEKDLFNVESFDITEEHDRNTIFCIAKILINNLLHKLNYKLTEIKIGNTKKIKIVNNMKYY